LIKFANASMSNVKHLTKISVAVKSKIFDLKV